MTDPNDPARRKPPEPIKISSQAIESALAFVEGSPNGEQESEDKFNEELTSLTRGERTDGDPTEGTLLENEGPISGNEFFKATKMKTYVQDNGHMYDESGNLLFVGYSGGNKGRNPEGLNNPALQSERMIGPIPVGTYSIGAPYNDATTGPDTMSLEPDPSNQMFGRSEFKCHGDNPAMNHSASEGCIVFSPARIRCLIYSGDCKLRVVAHEADRSSVPEPELST